MIPYAVMAYRGTRHISPGLSPNMMLFEREITEPIDLVVGPPPDYDDVDGVPKHSMIKTSAKSNTRSEMQYGT